MAFQSFYAGKKVLVTGHTGFKGSWLATWLELLGANVYGLALEPNTTPALFDILQLEHRIDHAVVDVRDYDAVCRRVAEVRPDVIFHLAAQAIVRLSYELPLETLNANVMGTAHLLDAVGRAGYSAEQPCFVVVVTSDKCYENREITTAYREEDPMGGHDIYSMSKGAAELVVASWRRSFFTRGDVRSKCIYVSTCRAGNVVGGGDRAPDRIMVDSIAAMEKGRPIPLRNPLSIRPWQHVLEPISGYLQVAFEQSLAKSSTFSIESAWNFGPGEDSERTVSELCDRIVSHWGQGSWVHVEESAPVHEAKFLKLSTVKALEHLDWRPIWRFDEAIAETVSWYKLSHECDNDPVKMRDKTESQIRTYCDDALKLDVRWAT